MLNDKKSQFFTVIALLVVLVSSICFYLLVRPDANGQTHLPGQMATVSHPVVATPGRLSTGITQSGLTGGRARGGTFSAPSAPSMPSYSSPSYSSPSYSSPSYSSPRRYTDYDDDFPRRAPRSYYPDPVPAPVIIPMPIPNPGYVPSPDYSVPTGGGLDIGFIFLLLVLGFAVLPIVLNYVRLGSSGAGTAPGSSPSELYNDIVTVTQLQIALVAQARELQHELNTLTSQADLSTQTGLSEMLRETVLALLRSPQYWTHVWARSETLRSREAASTRFEQLSIAERSKFRAETLVNVGGQVRHQALPIADDREPAAYIVVTLLVGSADDQPVIGNVQSAEALSEALQRLGSISPDYLLVYELLWTPQAENDSLTQEELLTQYPELVKI